MRCMRPPRGISGSMRGVSHLVESISCIIMGLSDRIRPYFADIGTHESCISLQRVCIMPQRGFMRRNHWCIKPHKRYIPHYRGYIGTQQMCITPHWVYIRPFRSIYGLIGDVPYLEHMTQFIGYISCLLCD